MRFIHKHRTASTNIDARKFAEVGEFGPLWVYSDIQEDGRGRRGRAWDSPEGNLYASHLFGFDAKLVQPGWFSFVAALAVYDTLETYNSGAEIRLKWPNDVLVGGRKVSGILLESGRKGSKNWMIVGIGINIAAPPKSANETATYLEKFSTKPVPTPQEVLQALSESFLHWQRVLYHQGFDPIRQAWQSASQGIPGPVTVSLRADSFQGYAEGLDKTGALRVRLPDGEARLVHAGDVYFGEGKP